MESQTVYSLFQCAVTEMEVAHLFWRKRQTQECIKALQASANCLIRAIITSQGLSVSEQFPLEKQLKELENSNDLCHSLYTNIYNVISLSTGSDTKNEQIKALYKDYQSALIDARKLLVRNTNYNDKLRQKLRSTFFTSVGLKKLSITLLPLVVVLLFSVAIYQYIDPIDSYDLDGQIFWKTSAKYPFTTKDSIRFPVVSDNQKRNYSVELESPANIFMLRLDPVNKVGLSDIEVEAIRLFGSDNKLLRELLFDNSMYWSCKNCLKLKNDSMTYRMRPTSNDPYLTSSKINQDKVKKITITMRAVSRKTFWEWILGIDKSMEF